MTSVKHKLKILTLNCYLLPPNPLLDIIPGVPSSQNAKESTSRIDDICDNILANNYDIVCLQEVWTELFKDLILSHLGSNYPFYTWFTSGYLPGSGQMILSKHEMLSSFFHPFLLEDKTFPFGSIDSICGKGTTVALVKYEENIVSVINTHPQSELLNDSKDALRLHQLWSLTELVNYCKQTSDLIVLCGDLNATPDFLGVKLIHQLCSTKDTITMSNPFSKLQLDVTYAVPGNSLVELAYAKRLPSGARIDYILTAVGSNARRSTTIGNIACEQCNIQPWGPLGAKSRLPFSDHEAVEATLSWTNDPIPETGSGDASLSSGVVGDDLESNGCSSTPVHLAKQFFASARLNSTKMARRYLISLIWSAIVFVMRFCGANFVNENLGLLNFVAITACITFGCCFFQYHYYKCAFSAFNQAFFCLEKNYKCKLI